MGHDSRAEPRKPGDPFFMAARAQPSRASLFEPLSLGREISRWSSGTNAAQYHAVSVHPISSKSGSSPK